MRVFLLHERVFARTSVRLCACACVRVRVRVRVRVCICRCYCNAWRELGIGVCSD